MEQQLKNLLEGYIETLIRIFEIKLQIINLCFKCKKCSKERKTYLLKDFIRTLKENLI